MDTHRTRKKVAKKDSVKASRKTAFEVKHNGRRVSVAGLKGRDGVINIAINSVKGESSDDLRLYVGGLDTGDNEHVRWVHKSLRMGDEVVG